MANDISTNPWVLDMVTSTVVLPSNTEVEHFEFVDYTADADACTVVNAAGKLVWAENGAADLRTVRSGKIGWVTGGLRLGALTAGAKVLVYHRP